MTTLSGAHPETARPAISRQASPDVLGEALVDGCRRIATGGGPAGEVETLADHRASGPMSRCGHGRQSDPAITHRIILLGARDDSAVRPAFTAEDLNPPVECSDRLPT